MSQRVLRKEWRNRVQAIRGLQMKGVFFNEDNLKYNLNVCMTTGVIDPIDNFVF